MTYTIIYVTTKTQKEAKKIAQVVLKKKLVACVNIIPRVESMYWWKKKIEHHGESVIIMKTKESLVSRVIETVKKVHSYSTPCIIAIPITSGNRNFLDWIDEVLR